MTIFLYRMTISSTWYDRKMSFGREYEMHFKIARPGTIRANRRELGRKGVRYFQKEFYREYRRRIRRGRVHVAFETEERAKKSERETAVTPQEMCYRGKWWDSTELPERLFSLAKKRRHAKNRRA